MEFPRTQRSINDRFRFKANEFRNMAFYDLIGILRDFLPAENYNHLLSYLLFLRLLTNSKIEKEDIKDADTLINFFNKLFEKFYGKSSVTFNLHAHLQLPAQVELFWPLNKTDVFPFEGLFKTMMEDVHGTRGLVKQISL